MIRITLVLSIAFGITGLSQAKAELITYSDSAVVSGTLGGNAFTDQLLTLTLTADTSGLTGNPQGLIHTSPATTTFTLGSLNGTITDTTMAFSEPEADLAGITDSSGIGTILGTFNAAFATYDLATPIGPLSGSAATELGPFGTTLGTLNFTTSPTSATFAATAQSVPEPSSLTLCVIAGLVGLGAARLCRLFRAPAVMGT
jgi:hypothetical protein